MTSFRLVLALLSGLLLALAFPDYNMSYLAWVAFVPLLLAAQGAPLRVGFLCGFLHGAAFFGITFSWIYTFLRGYGGLSPVQAVTVWTLLIVARSCFPGAFALGVAYLSRAGASEKPDRAASGSAEKALSGSREGPAWPLALIGAPFLWVATELALVHLPDINFIWNLLGYVVSGNLALVQMVTWTGIYGLAFVVVAYNALLTWMLGKLSRGAILTWATVTIALVLVLVIGPRYVPFQPAHYEARLVQTNLPVQVTYEANWLEKHTAELQDLEKLSVGDPESPPVLVVWPENPAPFSLQDPKFAEFASRTARASRDHFIVGVDDFRPGPQGKWLPHNSAAVLDANGRVVLLYDKIKLVPFGEYVPWRRFLTFARRLVGEVGDFEPGSAYKVGNLPDGKFSVFICYEAIFPEEVRRFVIGGAELLINISDDGWYGHSAALAQHLAMARVRAVENRRWFLRATNTGLTVAIDPYGRIRASVEPNLRAPLIAPYDFRSDHTRYARWGDWWPWLCVAVSAALLLAGSFWRDSTNTGTA